MRKLLTLPLDPTKTHTLAGKLQMMACLCSGKDWECQAFWRDLSASYYPFGDKAQKINITRITKNGWTLESRRDINPIDTTIARVLDFLSELVEINLSYSAINTARAALSACVTVENGMTLSEHILVKKFMKGVYELRPALPKYDQIWDPETVLQFLMKSSPLSVLSLKQLTLKLVMLTALVTGQRCQYIYLMDLSSMIKNENTYSFPIIEKIKTSKPGKPQPILILPKFTTNPDICVYYTTLYILYAAHSTRAAATSKAKYKHVPLTSIMKAAHWANISVFRKFYDLPIRNSSVFADSSLKS